MPPVRSPPRPRRPAAAAVVENGAEVYGQGSALSDRALGELKHHVQQSESYRRDLAKDAALQAGTAEAQLATAAVDGQPAPDEEDELLEVALCTETQLTFTLPPSPHGGESYHLRLRVMVDGDEKEPWTNPLMDTKTGWTPEQFFSPQLKGAKAKLQLAPPVVLGAEWERRHIQPKWRWQHQIHHPEDHEGEPRLFTIAGLIPSVKGSRGASWVGGGLYGERTIELQYKPHMQHAPQEQQAEWEDEAGWQTVPCREGTKRCSYHTPKTDVATMLLAFALNFLRAEGVPKLQETLVSEIGTKHRQSNIAALRRFASEAKDKLEPFWLAQVVPFLESSSVLQFALPERQDQWLRGVVLGAMQSLHKHHLIENIPPSYERDAPRIKLLSLDVAGGSSKELHLDQLDQWVEVQEGEDFALKIVAERSKVGLRKPRTTTMHEKQFGIRMWFVLQQSGDSTLSLRKLVRDGDDTEKFVSFGQKLRPKVLECDSEHGSASCVLEIKGKHSRHGYALLERGTEMSLRVICEENWAYENDHVTLRIRVVPPEDLAADERRHSIHRRPSERLDDSLREVLDVEDDEFYDASSGLGASLARTSSVSVAVMKERHIPRRLTAPRVFGAARTEKEVRATFRKSLRFLNLDAALDLNMPGRQTDRNRRNLLHDVLTELGHSPSDDDLDFMCRRMHERGRDMNEESMVVLYGESNWAKPMLADAFEQLEETVRKKRNTFLEESMKLPADEWGFAPNAWGFPKLQLWRRHSANLAKEQVHTFWAKQIKKMREGGDAAAASASDGDGDNDGDDDEDGGGDDERAAAVNLDDKDSLLAAPLVDVAEALGSAMTKDYLGRLLPKDGCFDAERRARWVEDVVREETLPHAVRQLSFYKLAEVQKKWADDARQREASKARQREKTEKMRRWLQEQSEGPTDSLPPEDISVSDIALEMLKMKVKEELQEVVVDELTAAWEHVKGDASARTQAFWARHWPLICGVALPCVVVPAVVCVKILRM